jgi:uncharacterized peroxidase-related enzyme
VEAHAESLRAEVPDRSAWVDAVKQDWRRASMTPREEAIAGYAAKLTRDPAGMRPEDLAPLRSAGLDDRAILDLAHVVGFFAYANRVADGLGCDLEAEMRPREDG